MDKSISISIVNNAFWCIYTTTNPFANNIIVDVKQYKRTRKI